MRSYPTAVPNCRVAAHARSIGNDARVGRCHPCYPGASSRKARILVPAVAARNDVHGVYLAGGEELFTEAFTIKPMLVGVGVEGDETHFVRKPRACPYGKVVISVDFGRPDAIAEANQALFPSAIRASDTARGKLYSSSFLLASPAQRRNRTVSFRQVSCRWHPERAAMERTPPRAEGATFQGRIPAKTPGRCERRYRHARPGSFSALGRCSRYCAGWNRRSARSHLGY